MADKQKSVKNVQMTQDEIEEAASEAYQYFETGVGDMLYIGPDYTTESLLDQIQNFGDEACKAAKEMIDGGCEDLYGAMADWFFNDPDTAESLMGDRIHDLVKGNQADFIRVAKELIASSGNTAVTTACDRWLERKE